MKKFIFLLLLIASCSGLFAEQSLPSGLTFSFLFNINSTFVPFYRLAYSMTEGQNYQSPGKSIAVGESSSSELTEPVVFFQITDCSDGAIHISNRKFIVTIDVSD